MEKYEDVGLDEDVEEEVKYLEVIFILQSELHYFEVPIYLRSLVVKEVDN